MIPATPPDGLRQTNKPDEFLSHLESDVLEEYATLRDNLATLSSQLATLAGNPGDLNLSKSTANTKSNSTQGKQSSTSQIADDLRGLERKTSLVCTALKASVYGILLQQQLLPDSASADGERFGRD